MKVWMRGRRACLTASQAASISLVVVRARPQITGTGFARAGFTLGGIANFNGDAAHGLQIIGRGGWETGLDHIHAQTSKP